ncbi:hypothetical protein B0J11DRAFT_540748 [Dendryphion nanum]|uniref:LYC1 C-terminal domain-containing protein n=1 Tax=Dendryphion nanum TaxID=256645 RepID=A0A9P9D7S4_9PLEO|nr:hypothetical protein B0J11DRAFT_540748 [Dendryphion nanum]
MGSTFELPMSTSPTLALVHPTEEEKSIQFHLNGAEWRGALSLPAYLRREEVLSSQVLTRDGGLTYWILIDSAAKGNALDPTSSARLPLASCETLRKRALVWQDGKLQEVICHGVGSVFCAPQLRGKRYAQRMFEELGQVLKTHQVTAKCESLFSVLYSDIGKRFYANHGWEPFNSSHISLPAARSKANDTNSLPGLPSARPLYGEDLEELCKIDEALIRRSLESRPKGSNIAVALIPDINIIRWHHAREEYVGTELHGKVPQLKGAVVGTEKGKRVWCYWTRMYYNEDPKDPKGNTLHILRIVMEDQESACWEEASGTNGATGGQDTGEDSHETAIAALLSMAQREAEEWGLEEVEAWNPSSATLAAARRLYPGVKVVDRDSESIASLRWFPEHQGSITESIDWIANEKHGWC